MLTLTKNRVITRDFRSGPIWFAARQPGLFVRFDYEQAPIPASEESCRVGETLNRRLGIYSYR